MDHRVTVQEADLSALLSDDVLADVLRRAGPRGLAASRCACKAWRALIDARRLLRADLLPLSLAGFLINFNGLYITEFFSPAAEPSCTLGKHDYLPGPIDLRCFTGRSWTMVRDHCNGLLLLEDGYVLNPATRYLALVPPCPPPPHLGKDCDLKNYLAYDPTVSPHCYEVFAIPRVRYKCGPGGYCYKSSMGELDLQGEHSEWPPSRLMLNVFSSASGRWEERSVVRQGEAAGTVADMRLDYMSRQFTAVYWRGALYVTCQTDFVMRISLSENKYLVIDPPPGSYFRHLGKSEKGVYLASIQGRCRLRVWILDESRPGSKMEWVLKHDRDLSEWLVKHRLEDAAASYHPKGRAPWILQNINDYYFEECHRYFYKNIGAVLEEKSEGNWETTTDGWRSEDEDESTEAFIEEKFECSSESLVDETFDRSSDNGEGHSGYHYSPATSDGINAWGSDDEDESTEAFVEEKSEGSSESLVDETFELSSNNEDTGHNTDESVGILEEEFDQSSDNEEVHSGYQNYNGYIQVLGFHPYKEIIFLSESMMSGLAYHLNSSKVEALGRFYPAGYGEVPNEEEMTASFPYTPCSFGPVDETTLEQVL